MGSNTQPLARAVARELPQSPTVPLSPVWSRRFSAVGSEVCCPRDPAVSLSCTSSRMVFRRARLVKHTATRTMPPRIEMRAETQRTADRRCCCGGWLTTTAGPASTLLMGGFGSGFRRRLSYRASLSPLAVFSPRDERGVGRVFGNLNISKAAKKTCKFTTTNGG